MVNLSMKQHSKFVATLLAFILAVNLFMPVSSLAQGVSNDTQRSFCNRVSEWNTKIDRSIADREAKLEARRVDRLEKLAEKRKDRDEKIAENRERWGENRDEHFAKLNERAQNDEQRQAVADFVAAVKTAIATRKAAINAAIQAFRQGIDKAIADRKTAVDDAVQSFKDAVSVAEAKAKADCDAGVDAATVRQNFVDSLKAAKDQFKADRQEIEKLKDAIKPLIDTRKAAIAKAIQDFKMAIRKAKADFKAVFEPGQEDEDENDDDDNGSS